MLLFILFLLFGCIPVLTRFNTSHVTLYRRFSVWRANAKIVSIHHMLLFIVLVVQIILQWPEFQYITCYSLSLPVLRHPVRPAGFNTSHVTLYLSSDARHRKSLLEFQYITCYSLSGKMAIKRGDENKFQYITCYSLSPAFGIALSAFVPVSIHHMLLFIDTGRERTPG